MELYLKKFEECPTYDQDDGPNVEFRRLLGPGVVPGLAIGLVTLQGPTYTKPRRHADFHQVYLIISGSGTVKIGEHTTHVQGPTIAVIPRDTAHSVELTEGETMQYIYISEFITED
nr:AraC family ligand binding domain-containing protein [Chloroflexota bacterium]